MASKIKLHIIRTYREGCCLLVNYCKLQRRTLSQFSTAIDPLPNRGHDPDVFGTLKPSLSGQKIDDLPEEEGDRIEVDYIDGIEGKVRLKPVHYAAIIKSHLKERRLADALDVLETRMLKKDHAKPDKYIYNLLISGCAHYGYTKKAFQLFNQMKKRAIRVTGGIYTSLFNACANSPWPNDGLSRALALKELMLEKRYQMNETNAHAMIKAFGHCGDIKEAFKVYKEMQLNNLKITSSTVNFLLHACISDKETGFRYALIVWREMLRRKIKPSIFTYNLILSCARNCGLGSYKFGLKDVEEILTFNTEANDKLQLADKELMLASNENSSQLVNRMSIPEDITYNQYSAINLLSDHIVTDRLVAINKISKKWHKLMLIGGPKGFIETMCASGVKPDIKTMTQLLLLIHPSDEAEEELMNEMKKLGIPLDIDFCNMLIKKRSGSSRSDKANEVLQIIHREALIPNIMTFGVLALACGSFVSARRLIRDIKNIGYRVNIEILATLLKAACLSRNIPMILYLLNILNKEKIKPNNIFLKQLENFQKETELDLQKHSSGSIDRTDKIDICEDEWKLFLDAYEQLRHVEVEDPESIHPWEQFRKNKVKENTVE